MQLEAKQTSYILNEQKYQHFYMSGYQLQKPPIIFSDIIGLHLHLSGEKIIEEEDSVSKLDNALLGVRK